jgi:hypothetical protein
MRENVNGRYLNRGVIFRGFRFSTPLGFLFLHNYPNYRSAMRAFGEG